MLLKEKPHITVIMEQEVLDSIKNAIKSQNSELFIKILIDFYDTYSSENIKIPKILFLKDYLRVKSDDNVDSLVRLENGKPILLNVEEYDSPFYMEDFVRNCTKGYYLYKNRIFDLRNYKEWCGYGDGYYVYTPYLEEVVSLETIERIGE